MIRRPPSPPLFPSTPLFGSRLANGAAGARAGVTCSIGADAHSTSGMANVAVGLGIARKGWLEPDQVLNTRDAEAFLAFARARLVAAGWCPRRQKPPRADAPATRRRPSGGQPA